MRRDKRQSKASRIERPVGNEQDAMRRRPEERRRDIGVKVPGGGHQNAGG